MFAVGPRDAGAVLAPRCDKAGSLPRRRTRTGTWRAVTRYSRSRHCHRAIAI